MTLTHGYEKWIGNQVDACPFYPPRPVNGGQLNLAPVKFGAWWYEAKVNGWRSLVHAPSGTMFNRLGERLSIAGEFKRALQILQSAWESSSGLPDWIDCEALERRHNIGKGTLIVLDICDSTKTYRQRCEVIQQVFIPLNKRGEGPPCGDNEVRCLTPEENGWSLWTGLQQENARLGGTPQSWFYEGVVAKRDESLYPMQHRSPETEFPYWQKHRFSF